MPRLIAFAVMGLLIACNARTEVTGRDHPLAGTIWAVDGGERIERSELVARLSAADYAILGEVHDNPVHHDRQAALTEAIAPAGLAFEMIPEASEEGIRIFLEQGGERAEIGDAIGWARLGWPDWEMYAPIATAAPGAHVAGGGVARSDLRRAMKHDAAAAFGSGAQAYGLTDALDPETRAAMEAEMLASHCDKLPEAMAARMVESQRLRDARFAHALRRAAAMGGGRAVLITGNGHARTDRGVPAALRAAEPGATTVSLGQIEVREGAEAFGDYAGEAGPPFDYVWFSPRTVRDDPCAAFEP